jgi:hypothetical protein
MMKIAPLLNGVEDDCEVNCSGYETAEKDYKSHQA